MHIHWTSTVVPPLFLICIDGMKIFLILSYIYHIGVMIGLIPSQVFKCLCNE